MAWAAGLGFTIYSYSTAVQAKKRLYSADLESTDQKKKAQEHFTGIRPRGVRTASQAGRGISACSRLRHDLIMH